MRTAYQVQARATAILMAVISFFGFCCAARADTSFDSQVATVRSFFEYAWGFTLDDKAANAVRQGLTAEFYANAVATDNAVHKMSDLLAWEAKQPEFIRNYVRMELEPRLVVSIADDPAIPYVPKYALLGAWLQHNPDLARGNPPLTQNVVDAAREFTKFVDQQAGQPVPDILNDPRRYGEVLAAQYASAPADEQLNFSLIVPLWYKVQYIWAHISAADQNKVREQLRSNANTAQAANGTTSSLSQSENFYNKVIAGPQALNIQFNQGVMEHFNEYGF